MNEYLNLFSIDFRLKFGKLREATLMERHQAERMKEQDNLQLLASLGASMQMQGRLPEESDFSFWGPLNTFSFFV